MKTIAIAIGAGIALSAAPLLSIAGAALVTAATIGSLTLAHYAGRDDR